MNFSVIICHSLSFALHTEKKQEYKKVECPHNLLTEKRPLKITIEKLLCGSQADLKMAAFLCEITKVMSRGVSPQCQLSSHLLQLGP